MKVNYSDRKIFWGNELLVLADVSLDSKKKIVTENIKLVTGLVSVGSMEDQAETTNYPADDVPDHGFKKGATLLQGEMVFIQTDQELREDLLGWKKTANGLGWSPTGNFKTKLVQYLIKGRKRNVNTGIIEDGWKIILYPQLTPTSEPTFESETDSVDGVDPIQWTFSVQATASDVYTNAGTKVPFIEYEIWGDQAKAFEAKMEENLFIMLPDTVLDGGEIVPSAITLNKKTASVATGATEQLTATVTPGDAVDKSVTWSSSDKSIATVSAAGLVTGVAAGSATITAKTSNNLEATAAVTVTAG